MNETRITDDRRFNNESTIEGIAAKLATDLGLWNRVWSCDDDRRDVLAEVVEQSVREHGWDDAERDWFAGCLSDEAAKCVQVIEFRTINRFPGYRFGSDGSVWSCWQRYGCGQMRLCETWVQLNPTLGSRGYLVVSLRGMERTERCLLVHRLILEAFKGPCPADCEARHFPDGTKTNNAITNLIWGTRSENHQDKWQQGKMPHGESHPLTTLTDDQVREIRVLNEQGVSQVRLAEMFGVVQGTIWNILNNRSWSHVA